MAKKPLSRCTECSAPTIPGEVLCPRCFAAALEAARPVPGSDALLLDLLPAREEPRRALVNTLFECWRCNRLVEMQAHQGRSVVPRFCPWCGKAPSSILGREIDGYRIDEVIAAGSFGLIYLASNLAQPMMKAVVKFLRPDMSYHHPELVKIFVEEARLTEEIGQACWNIVRVSNVREEPWPYFFMEYVRGTTMDEVIEGARVKKLPLGDCVGYLRGIAKALAATHHHGRVHRDLKPLNVMVMTSEEVARPEDKIKLLDFGLAMKIASRRVSMRPSRALDPGAPAPPEHDHRDSPIQSAGTPEYMAPEAFDGINDYAADIYSFGVTAYQILTGELPWPEPALGAERLFYWRNAHRKKPPRPVREVRSDIPTWLARLIMQCLEKDPGQRPHRAEQLAERLEEPVSPWVWIAGAAAVLLVALLGWMAMGREQAREIAAWTVDGVSFEGEKLTLWTTSEADLPRRKVHGMVQSQKAILDCDASSPSVHVAPGGDRFSVELDRDPKLMGSSVSIQGNGSGFRFRGAISIQKDASPPRVGPLEAVEQSRGAGPLEPGMRLQAASVALRAAITEPNFHEAALSVKNAKGEPRTIPQREPSPPLNAGEEHVVSFPLQDLGEGSYSAWVVARDLAGNENPATDKRVELVIDESIQVYPTQDWKAWVARGQAYYGFRLGADEKIKSVDVLDSKTKKSVKSRLFESSVDVATAADCLDELRPVTPAQLQPGKAYLVAVPLPATADESVFELNVADAAMPPNSKSWPLVCERQPRLTADDVLQVSITLPGGAPPHVLSRADLAPGNASAANPDQAGLVRASAVEKDASPGEPGSAQPAQAQPAQAAHGGQAAQAPTPLLEAKSPRFIRSPRIEKLEVTASPGKLLHGTCASSAARQQARAQGDSVAFEGIELQPDETARLELALFDSLEGSVAIALDIHPDTRPPVVSILPGKDARPRYYTSAPEVKLTVESDEPLQATASSAGKIVEAFLASRDRGSFHYSFLDLEELLPADGTYELEIRAVDRALWPAEPQRVAISLNSRPPRVWPIADQEKDERGELKHWKLNLRTCRLNVTDENGVDPKGARCVIEYRKEPGSGAAQTLTVDIVPQNAAIGVYSIGLRALPNPCSGKLKPIVADKLGWKTTDEIPFLFVPRERLKREVPWRGMAWVLVTDRFYISKTEVTNQQFRSKAFIVNGAYRSPELRKTGRPPMYWGKGGEFPEYVTDDGKAVPGDDFPVVGIGPREAEAFGAAVFTAARLPRREEWLRAARAENPGGKHPWKDEENGKSWFNYRRSWSRPDSLLAKHHYAWMKAPRTPGLEKSLEKILPYRPVEASYCLFPDRLVKAGEPFTRIWHILGNVAELVKLPDGSYGSCGGSFDTDYDQAALDIEPDPFGPDEVSRSPRIGFRLVLPIEGAPAEFLSLAVESDEE